MSNLPSKSILQNIPEAAQLLKMETQELAGYVLEHLHAIGGNPLKEGNSLPHNLANALAAHYSPKKDEAYKRIIAACHWLISNGYLQIVNSQGFFEVSQKGTSLPTAAAVNAQLKSSTVSIQSHVEVDIKTTSAKSIAVDTTPVDYEALRAELSVIYDQYRTAAMNEKYYANRLTHLTNWNRYYEIVLAIGTSTAIAAWAIWEQNNWAKIFWAGFSGVITLLAIIKPFLKFPEQIEKYSTLHTGYRALYLNLQSITSKIRRKSRLTPDVQELFDAAQDQYKALALNDAVNINQKVLKQCQEQVIREIPVDTLWYPLRPGDVST